MTEYYYDRQGQPITFDQWGAYLKEHCYRCIGRDVLADGVIVSTVWLGFDHSFGDGSGPLIFETMVFRDGAWGDCWRYRSEVEAQAGHTMVVESLRR